MNDALLPGTVFAGYPIVRMLGRGGMGTVYLARHPRLPRRDALKVMSAEQTADPAFRARFIREADLAARLDHPNIVAVYDRGVEYGRLWIAMQFVDGTDAAELIRRSPGGVPSERAVHIVRGVARGLDEAHRAGMLHRDVKPANILIEPQRDEPERIYVTDFGIARTTDESTVLTETGAVLATLAYAAPEQLTGRAVDHRADIYALGCTLYELLTGAKPFHRASAAAVLQAQINDPPPRASAANPQLPPQIDHVLTRALAKNPDHRQRSCGELAAAAATALGHDRHAFGVHPAAPRRRARVVVGVAALTAVVVLGIVSILVLNRNSDRRPSTSVTSAVAAPGTPSTTVTSPTITSGQPSWGSYLATTRLFPGLIPATPTARGYQDIECDVADKDWRRVDVNAPVDPQVIRLSCRGRSDPVAQLKMQCNVSRGSRPLLPFADMTVEGDQRWERISGTGKLIWGHLTGGDKQGVALIGFDDGSRSHCQIVVIGGSSGQELYDRWWRDAPL
ncbi:serine/threonine-protein kinase [Nocardia sp. NPDC052566]|uniref:serine/threonine-protein kinase n=1 Tax=Nocardia sp. NPDC052566 TaxID=3364330 RepID=UPI0037C94032